MEVVSSIAAALGMGFALASAPGPVQAVILSEAVRGGPGRGLRVTAGAALTFGTLLVALALGIASVAIDGTPLRVLQVLGGILLVWLAVDGLRASAPMAPEADGRGGLPPMARGSLAVLLNPGAWLFLAGVATPVLASAALGGGRASAVLTAVALEAGTATGDALLAILAGTGIRRLGAERVRLTQRLLAAILAALGAWLIYLGLSG
jgi:threonine/homoserine/homoserine lactone efflux protein